MKKNEIQMWIEALWPATDAAWNETETKAQGAAVHRFFMEWSDDLVFARDVLVAA